MKDKDIKRIDALIRSAGQNILDMLKIIKELKEKSK